MEQSNNQQTFNFIDLFAGCGGLSEGFYREGFNAIAHVERDKDACETLRERMRFYNYKEPINEVVEADITSDDIIAQIDNAIKDQHVDVIIGGPPCQAYSTAGRTRGQDKTDADPRNFLFEAYIKILEHYKPKIFVFENVTGLFSAKVKGQKILPLIFNALGNLYNVTSEKETILLNSVHYGVPQVRKRIIIIGVRKDITSVNVNEIYHNIIKTHYDEKTPLTQRFNLKKYVTVQDAIYDLPPIEPSQDASTNEFNYPCNNEFLQRIGKPGVHPLMDHICRKHNPTDRERFKQMTQNKWTFVELLQNMPHLQHDKPRAFKDNYCVQWADKPSKTIIAHLSQDGTQFIHPNPKQARTFTVREAARLQSFPDDFVFKGSRSQKFKQIGNAVPVLMAEAIAKAVKQALTKINQDNPNQQ